MESDGLEGMLELVNWAVLLEAHIQLRDGEPLVSLLVSRTCAAARQCQWACRVGTNVRILRVVRDVEYASKGPIKVMVKIVHVA